MRRRYILTILAAALATVSCERTVEEIWSSDNDAMLVLNAQLKQDAKSHRVFVHCSSGSNSEVVKDAEVTVSVNGASPVKGVPLAYTEELYDGYTIDFFDGYEVTVDLAPGDKIDVKAKWQSLTASATVEVPAACGLISALDTGMINIPAGGEDGHDYRSRQYNIAVQDRAGEKNYYLLVMEDTFYRISPSGEKLDSITVKGDFDSTSDPLLHPMETSLLEELIGDDNRYNIFTDESFDGTFCTLKVMDNIYGYYDDKWTKFWEPCEFGEYYSLDRAVKVYTLTFEEYIYLKSIMAANSDLGFMTEPVIFAENVTGGLGFVTAMTPSVYTISFPAEPYAGEPPVNAYRYKQPWIYNYPEFEPEAEPEYE